MPSARTNGATLENIDLRSIFRSDCIQVIPSGVGQVELLRQLLSSLSNAGRLPDERVAQLLKVFVERERNGTTAIGNGLAFPHRRTDLVDEFVGAIGVAPDGVDFGSLDSEPTHLIMLWLSPLHERERNFEVLRRMSTLIADKTLQYSVRRPRSPEELYRLLGF